MSVAVDDNGTISIVNKPDRNVWYLTLGASGWIQKTTSGGFDRVAIGPNGLTHMRNSENVYFK